MLPGGKMEGWSLILLILLIALLGFALLMATVVLVIRFSQKWIDEYQARQGKEHGGSSAADLYMESLRKREQRE